MQKWWDKMNIRKVKWCDWCGIVTTEALGRGRDERQRFPSGHDGTDGRHLKFPNVSVCIFSLNIYMWTLYSSAVTFISLLILLKPLLVITWSLCLDVFCYFFTSASNVSNSKCIHKHVTFTCFVRPHDHSCTWIRLRQSINIPNSGVSHTRN